MRNSILFQLLVCQLFCPIKLAAQSLSFPQLLKLAQEGNATSQFFLARKYEEGDGVEMNLDSAIVWYKKAINGGRNIANVLLGSIYDREKKQIKAYPYYMQYYEDVKMAMESGNRTKVDQIDQNLLALSQYKIGEYKLYGFDGIKKDIEGAIRFLKDAANNNYGVAAYLNLSNAYLETKDSVNAFNNIKIAFEKYHDDMSIAKLALCYIQGIGCKKNYEAAYDLLEPIAVNGNQLVLVTIGDLCRKENFSRHDDVKAFQYYSLLLEKSHEPLWKGTALRRLSRCYRFGRGVKKDLQKAEKLMKEAAQYGDKDAKSLLEMTGIN